jgi:hypothetical protein
VKPIALLATAATVKSGSTCTAVIDGATTTIQVARDLTVAVGDVLLVHRVASQWFASSRHFAAAPGAVVNDSAPDPQPSVVTGTLTVAPTLTGTWWGSGWSTRDDNVRQGQRGAGGNETGAVFYGDKPRSLAGATVVSASVAVRRANSLSFVAQPTTMWLVTEDTRPAGAPTLTSSAAGPQLKVGETDNAFTVPVSWVQAMVDGTAGGLGFYEADGSPYVVLAGRGEWSPAFTLKIKWTRG